MMEGAVRLPVTPTFQVLVHRFSWCSCCDESYPAGHIKIESFERPLESGQAIALSYGIGDFDRQQRLFGHVDGLTSQPVRLEFGGEWEMGELTKAFVALSEKHGAIWFDQLSIPQDPASIATHLQRMPQIYRTLEVVVLLPNAPCPCLRDAFRSWTSEGAPAYPNGGFDMDDVMSRCLNAVPVSSYCFRLWTRQEFAYARTISIHYCGAPGGKCSRGIFRWMYKTTRIPTTSPDYLSRWASWKYALCAEEMQSQSELLGGMAWSNFRDAHKSGLGHLMTGVAIFHLKKDIILTQDRYHALLTEFLLGDKLQGDRDLKHENMFIPPDAGCEHVASVQKDFALAVLPAFEGYRLPQRLSEMTLLELIDDGVEQCERYRGYSQQTMLPLGLFKIGLGSMRCKPSIHLREEHIKCLGDVYGALKAGAFPPFCIPEVTILRMRDPAQPPVPRMAQSKTYSAAFRDATTAEVCKFVRKMYENFGGWFCRYKRSRATSLEAWAGAVFRYEVAVPWDRWPSPAHEQAIFEELIRHERPWGSLPEVDLEKACYDFMCDYVCIHPEVAREKRLGLVVKTSDPPCIGFVNGLIYEAMEEVEQYQRHHGVPPLALRTRSNSIYPEDWLTIMVSDEDVFPVETMEAIKVDRLTDFAERLQVKDLRMYKAVPMYSVVGVWFDCRKDDPAIGAEILESSDDGYDAVLV